MAKKFNYTARDKEGNLLKDQITALNTEAVENYLNSKDLTIIRIAEDRAIDFQRLSEINIGGVPMKEKVVFMRQLSVMVASGVSLNKALAVLQRQANNPRFRSALGEVLGDVESGLSLSKSLRKVPDVFDTVVINLIQAGEESGNLEDVLVSIADDLEANKKLQDKLRSAMNYPIIIMAIIVVILVLLLWFLVPAMSDIYSQFGAELPAVTQFLVDASEIFLKFWWLLFILVAGFGIGIRYLLRTPKGKYAFHRLVLKMPVFGVLVKEIQITKFTKTLSLLLKSGVSITNALDLTAGAMSNKVFEEELIIAKGEVEKGVNLSIPLARSEVFPLIISQMINVGEESGALDSVLEKMASYYKNEVDVKSENLTSLLEPLILVVVGGLIGFIAYAVYTPIFSLTQIIE